MAKPKRSFYDRAWEALLERHGQRSTQALLAALAGVKQPTVNDWKEKGPKLANAVRLAENLGVCVEWLYTERGPKRPGEGAPMAPIWAELDEDERTEISRFAAFLRSQKKQ